ncbi:MAG: hypothetical protein AAGF46_05250, partial [Pseudomonadota bacterium]
LTGTPLLLLASGASGHHGGSHAMSEPAGALVALAVASIGLAAFIATRRRRALKTAPASEEGIS